MVFSSKKTVGVIGLGIIGTRVAQKLRAAGHTVYVYNRSPQPVPNFLGSPAQLAEHCQFIQLFVRNSEDLLEVMERLAQGPLTRKHIIINSATVSADAVEKAAKIAASREAGFVNAPFTGSKAAAEKGALIYYTGGSDDLVRKAQSVLSASAREIIPVGTPQQAATVKLGLNMLAAVQVAGLAEVLGLMQGHGIEPSAFVRAMEPSAIRSGLIDVKAGSMLNGEFSPHFTLANMLKDSRLAQAAAGQVDQWAPLAQATGEILAKGVQEGWGDLDFAAVAKLFVKEPAKTAAPPTVVKPEPAPATVPVPANAPDEQPSAADSKTAAPVPVKVPAGEQTLSVAAVTATASAPATPEAVPGPKPAPVPETETAPESESANKAVALVDAPARASKHLQDEVATSDAPPAKPLRVFAVLDDSEEEDDLDEVEENSGSPVESAKPEPAPIGNTAELVSKADAAGGAPEPVTPKPAVAPPPPPKEERPRQPEVPANMPPPPPVVPRQAVAKAEPAEAPKTPEPAKTSGKVPLPTSMPPPPPFRGAAARKAEAAKPAATAPTAAAPVSTDKQMDLPLAGLEENAAKPEARKLPAPTIDSNAAAEPARRTTFTAFDFTKEDVESMPEVLGSPVVPTKTVIPGRNPSASQSKYITPRPKRPEDQEPRE